MFDILLSGSGATLVFQTPKKLYVSWIGDSNVLVAGKSNEEKEFLNQPAHRPSRDGEKYRIYNAKGEIRKTNDGFERVYMRARMYPGLKISRTLGDLIPHQIGVISEPSFVCH